MLCKLLPYGKFVKGYFCRENKENNISLSSTELAQGVVEVNQLSTFHDCLIIVSSMEPLEQSVGPALGGFYSVIAQTKTSQNCQLQMLPTAK